MTSEVLVVGGGPVGFVAAIHAARAGLRVRVVEPRTLPVDKACGEGLMPGALQVLHRLGIDPPGASFLGIRYLDATARRVATADFRDGVGRGVRRTVLHEHLVHRAKELGVETVHDRCLQLTTGPRGVNAALGRAGTAHADFALVADGLHSPIRSQLGLDRLPTSRNRFGQRRHYQVQPWSHHVEVYWSRYAEAYVTPIGPHEAGVALLARKGSGSFDELLGKFPALCRRLSRATRHSAVMGAGPMAQGSCRRTSGQVLLIGDAAGYVDALTGEGLAVGFAMAAAAVTAVVAESPDLYEREWPALTRRARWATQGLLTSTSIPVVRSGLIPVAAALQPVFTRAVNAVA